MTNNSISSTGNSFIDENHADLLEHINQFPDWSNNDWDQNIFKDFLSGFIRNLENHFSHEEIILRGAEYAKLNSHIIMHRKLALKIHIMESKEVNRDEATGIVSAIRSNIIEHEMFEDQKYWSLFDGYQQDKLSLVSWAPEYDTDNPDINREHLALFSHVNRFYLNLKKDKNSNRACAELKMLHAYSKHHFDQEELLLGTSLRQAHAANHQQLTNDLNTLIDEIAAGKYDLDNLGDYIRFWLLNHIKTYDIPAFKGK